jgi:hypothetical protein
MNLDVTIGDILVFKTRYRQSPSGRREDEAFVTNISIGALESIRVIQDSEGTKTTYLINNHEVLDSDIVSKVLTVGV